MLRNNPAAVPPKEAVMSESMKILVVPPQWLKTADGKRTPETFEKTRQLFTKLQELVLLLWLHFLKYGSAEKVELLKIDKAYQDANDFYGVLITLILSSDQIHRNILLEAFWRLPEDRLEIGIKVADDKNDVKRNYGVTAKNTLEAANAILTYLFKYFNQNATLLARFAEGLIPDKQQP